MRCLCAGPVVLRCRVLPFARPCFCTCHRRSGLLGAGATFMALSGLVRRQAGSAAALVLTLLTWASWFAFPISRLGLIVRFAIERPEYEIAVRQTAGGAQPACVGSRRCASDGYTPPYLFFPYTSGALLTPALGVLYVPPSEGEPSQARVAAFGSYGTCESKPIAHQFYVCFAG